MEENKGKIEVGDIFALLGEDDQEQEIEVLGLLTIDGVDYAAVGFAEDTQDEESEEEMDVFFLRVEEGEEFSIIESDEEFDMVSSAFMEAEEAVE